MLRAIELGAIGLCFGAAVVLIPAAASARSLHPQHHHKHHHSRHAKPHPVWPLEIGGAQYIPASWADIAGWTDDDQLAAFKTFRISCKSILASRKPPAESKALGTSLREPCRVARHAEIDTAAQARAFFEHHFVPLRISKLGDAEGFVTGYYEPVIEGSRTPSDVYTVPVYRRPSNLFVRGVKQSAAGLPNKGQVFRKIGRRKLVPYYDRGEIEDGAISGRGLEICWLKSATDLLFTQIQGSARVKLEDGSTLRINYDAHNGYPYTPIGRILIDRGLVAKEQMSMQRIRQWMDDNPDGAKELRRQNRSYVFFREVNLSDKDEAVGAQGVPLTPGRSIAVDKALHVYGTPFFIEAPLPIEGEQSATPFNRLMVAQDTGSAIVGPARADLYFGAGAEAGAVAGRMRHPARFALLLPNRLDPRKYAHTMPIPEPRPSAKIAKLFPAKDAVKDSSKEAGSKQNTKPSDVTADVTKQNQGTAASVPLPEARPPSAKPHRAHPHRRWHHRR